MASVPLTDFTLYSHPELVAMLDAGDVASAQHAADVWRQVARSFAERARDVEAQLEEFAPYWKGGAADQYKMMMLEFIEGVDEVSDILGITKNLVHSSAESLAAAKKAMPGVVPVPDLSATATAFQPALDGSSPIAWAALTDGQQSDTIAAWDSLDVQQQQSIVSEIENRQTMALTSGSAHAEAIAVMSELAVQYLGITETMPAMPTAGKAPAVPETESVSVENQTLAQADIDNSVAMRPGITTTGAHESLFNDMFAYGSLAAGAAVTGRFAWGSGTTQRKKFGKSATAGLPTAGGGLGSIGGGGSIGAGGALGGVIDSPRANPVLTGGGAAATGGSAAAFSPAAAGAATGLRGAGMGSGMMPMAPMGGGDGAGAGRRPPNWLVERESVFGGEELPVTPAVIGAAPDGVIGAPPRRT